MPYFVYILYSQKDKGLYVGCSKNIENRFRIHNLGNVLVTKGCRPLVLIYTEQIDSKAEAFQRERFLKSLWGAREKQKILKNYINKIGCIN